MFFDALGLSDDDFVSTPAPMVMNGEVFIGLRGKSDCPLSEQDAAMIRSRPDCVVFVDQGEWALMEVD